MARRKKRRKGRRGRSPVTKAALVGTLILLVLGVGIGPPSASFSIGESDRDSSVAVVDDTDGVVTLNKTSELREDSPDNCLVEVTNHMGESTTVTVSLASSSGDLGSLKTDPNGSTADSVEFSLGDGATETVYMEVKNGTAGNTSYYAVEATTPETVATLSDRSSPITETSGGTCE